MSRSRRKTPIIGMTTAPSDKAFKVDEHRAERHAVRAVVKRSLDSDDRALHAPCGRYLPTGASSELTTRRSLSRHNRKHFRRQR
jgi:hypothetical protein